MLTAIRQAFTSKAIQSLPIDPDIARFTIVERHEFGRKFLCLCLRDNVSIAEIVPRWDANPKGEGAIKIAEVRERQAWQRAKILLGMIER